MICTFAGWLLRPISIFLTNNLLASFNDIVPVAAIFDRFHVVIFSLVTARHVASLNFLRRGAEHHYRGNRVKRVLSNLLQKKKSTSSNSYYS